MSRSIEEVQLPLLVSEPSRVATMQVRTYRAIPAMNASTLVHGIMDDEVDTFAVKRSWEVPYVPTPSQKDKMDKGTLAHLLMLEPHLFDERIAVWHGATRRGGEWDLFQDANLDKLIMRAEDVAEVMEGVAVALAFPQVKRMLSDGKAEQAVTGQEGSLRVKGLIDFLGNSTPVGTVPLVDIKTTWGGVDYRSVTNTTVRMKYREKMAWYRRLASAAIGVPVEQFRVVLLFVRLDQPFGVHVLPLESSALDWADARMMRVLKATEKCIDSGVWTPFYQESGFGLTSYELNQMDQLDFGDDDE